MSTPAKALAPVLSNPLVINSSTFSNGIAPDATPTTQHTTNRGVFSKNNDAVDDINPSLPTKTIEQSYKSKINIHAQSSHLERQSARICVQDIYISNGY
jgi:hypothetical protein